MACLGGKKNAAQDERVSKNCITNTENAAMGNKWWNYGFLYWPFGPHLASELIAQLCHFPKEPNQPTQSRYRIWNAPFENHAAWGTVEGADLLLERGLSLTTSAYTSNAYAEVVRWKRNLFMVPTGKVGDSFVKSLDLWRDGKIPELVSECRCIQQRLNSNRR